MSSPYQIFNNWLFDYNLKTPLPSPKKDENGKDIIPDFLKYNSPINETFLIKLFLYNGELNNYLDTWFNNINLRYLDREEFFYFIKKCVIDYKIQKRNLVFYSYRQKDKLQEKLKYKYPLLKLNDIELLAENILKSKEKDDIMYSLGLEKEEKVKKGKGKKEIKKSQKKNEGKINYNNIIEENFSIYEI